MAKKYIFKKYMKTMYNTKFNKFPGAHSNMIFVRLWRRKQSLIVIPSSLPYRILLFVIVENI